MRFARWSRVEALSALDGVLLSAILLSAVLFSATAGSAAAQQSSPEAVQVYASAANFQNNGAYDIAVEEWKKFLKRFPKDPLVPKATHYLGVCHMQADPPNLAEASAAFAEVIEKHPKFTLREDSYLNLGWTQFARGQQASNEQQAALFDAAIKTFVAMLKEFPAAKGKHADQANFFMGESYYLQGKKTQALFPYAEVVKNFPKSSLRPDALYGIGVCYEELAKFADADKMYELYLKEFPQAGLVNEVVMRRGECALQLGAGVEKEKPAEAQASFVRADALFAQAASAPDFAQADHAKFRQAYTLAKLDKFDAAGAAYGEVATKFPQSLYVKEASLSAGRSYYRAEDMEKAADWFAKVIELGGKETPEASHWLARIYIRGGKFEDALALVDQVIPKAGENVFLPQLKLDRADALFELPARRAEALADYLRLAKEHPGHEVAPEALYNASFTALDLKKHEEASQHAAAFVKAYPESALLPDTRNVAAEADLQLKRYPAAEAAFRSLVETYPQHAEVEKWRLRLGLVLYLQEQFPAALAAVSPVDGFRSEANRAEALYLSGISQFYLLKHAEAVDLLRASLEIAPDAPQAEETWLFLSRAQKQKGDFKAAVEAASKMLELFPQGKLADQARYRLGEYHYAAGDFTASAKAYDEMLAKHPQSTFAPFAIYGKGWALLKGNENDGAAELFTTMLKDHPGHTLAGDAAYGRALAYRQLGKHAEAIGDIDAYLAGKLAPNDRSTALYQRGLSESALAKHDLAVKTFQGLLTENPKFTDADKVVYELAWALKSLNQTAQATEQFKRLAKDFPESDLAAEAHFRVGEAMYEGKDYQAAADSYTVAKDLAGKSKFGESAWYKLGWSRHQLGDHVAALAAFEKQVEGFPEGDLRADGLFMQAESLFKQEKYDLAWKAYGVARPAVEAQKQPTPEVREILLLHGAQAAAQGKMWEASLEWLGELASAHKESLLVPEALYETGFAKQNLDQIADAALLYEQAADLAEQKRNYKVGARSRFMLGELEFARKNHVEAIKQFQRVMFGFGGDKAADDVKEWQAMAAFEAGRCAEVRVAEAATPAERSKLAQDALKAYKFVVEKHAQHRLAGDAAKRVAELEKLK